MSKINDNRLYSDMKCIWMESYVEYKLCDRQFDCENCMFDKAVRNMISPAEKQQKVKRNDIIQQIIDNIGNEELNVNYTYLNNHLMVKNLFENTYYLGFSSLALNLLDNCNSVEYCDKGAAIAKGSKIIEINGDWGKVSVTAPMNFTCLGKIPNEEKKNAPLKWFSLINTTKEELAANSLQISDYHRDIITVTKEITQIQLKYPQVGLTMMDGGTNLEYLFQILGKDNYLDLLNSLFSKKNKDEK
ncbi:MAG: hypothetical protein ACM3RX_05620 [Methanococcaceae archaeon]